MHRLRRWTMASRIVALLLLLSTGLVSVAAVAISSQRAATASQERFSTVADLARDAADLRYRFADLNGWQTAYALDVALQGPDGARDASPSRKAFLASVSTAQRDLDAVTRAGQSVIDAEELALLTRARTTLDTFMQVDRDIVAKYLTGKAADKAQDASRRLAGTIRLLLSAQSRLREVVVAVSEVDLASNRFRLGPIKDKFKSPIDSIQRLEVEPGGDDPIKDVRQLAGTLYELATKDGGGLLALRAAVLAKTPDAEAAYAKQRKAILDPIEQQIAKLNALLDTTEAQAAKQRQVLEAALKLRNEPGGVVGTSEEVSLHIREMVGTLRLLMLAGSEADAKAAVDTLVKVGENLTGDMKTMRAGLVKMGKPQLAQQVDAGLAEMATVMASVAKVAASKQQLLGSEARMAQSLASLKGMAAQQARLGEAQVQRMSQRQGEVVAAVDGRVQTSLIAILSIAGLAIAITSALSWHLVRTVTRRLNAAVEVAEQVSRGELVEVPVIAGQDETTRLMAAMAKMVQTLEGIVGNIRQAATQIHHGSGEISTGNQDLSQRTEQQASQLQQTASAVEQLTATVQRNAESARHASQLADRASDVASHGGERVQAVVGTMDQIEASSRQIAAIVSVIDGIAFQTNILALNAAVEAARAGEQGRGFAVVASEVRALAGKSAEAAHQVKDIVDHSVQAISGGSALVREAGGTMEDIVRQVRDVSALIGEIARASDEQAASVSEVGHAVQTLDNLTQQNAALAEQSSSAAVSLRRQAEGLTQAIAVFGTA